MRDLFQIPQKYAVSGPMKESLSADPLVIADIGSAMGLDARWQPVTAFLDVLSFEPDARSDSDGTVFLTALGAEVDTERTLHLSKLPAASSFYSHHPEMDRFVVRDWLSPAGEETVPVTTLDACLGERRVDFLKIDVEGADLDVLQGAEHTLREVLAIQIEVSFAARHVGAPGFGEIDAFLTERGFRLHRIAPEHWLRENAAFGGNSNPQLIWGDAVYLRTKIPVERYAHWTLILQAYGFHDFAIDTLPDTWHSLIGQSVRGEWQTFWMLTWRLALALILIPVFWRRASSKAKLLAASLFAQAHRIAARTGPKRGIFPPL